MIELFSVPYILRVLISLFIILLVNKISGKLWIALFAGIITLSVWIGHPISGIISITRDKISSPNTLFLMGIVLLVIWLSNQMSETNIMKELVAAVNSLATRRASMAVLPAVIGLLPMPGGAIFSAPLVDDCDYDNTIDPILKTKINYWFRHIWEYWWPLYPGVLLAVEITGISIIQFMLLMLPLSLISVLAGYLFLLRKVTKPGKGEVKRGKSDYKQLVFLISPVLIIVITYIIISIFMPFLSALNKYLPMLSGIIVSMTYLQIVRPLRIAQWKKIAFSLKTFSLILVVALVLIYGAFIEARLPSGTPLMAMVKMEMNSMGIPPVLLIILIPFICGMTTGLAVGFVGASFPIVMNLIGVHPESSVLLSTTILAYGSGYMGMILSPVHVCLIVTNEFFQTSMVGSLMRLIRPVIFVLIGVGFLYIIRSGLIGF